MEIREIINSADELRNNDISDLKKISWLSELDESIFEQIVLTHEGANPRAFPYKKDTESLIAPDRFRELYEHFLCAKIDYCQNEIDRYENDITLFERALSQFKAWYNENYLPLKKATINTKPSFLRGEK